MRPFHGKASHIFASSFAAFADGIGQFIGFCKAVADSTFAISDEDESRKAELASAFNHLRAAVDIENFFVNSLFAFSFLCDSLCFAIVSLLSPF